MQDEQKTVNLFFGGAGSVGSKVIESVVRTTLDPRAAFAIKKLAILDHDVLETGNLMRHEALPEEVGLEKTEIMKRRIAKLAPAIDVEVVKGSIHDDETRERTDTLVASSDVLVATFDNNEARSALNALSVEHEKPLLVAEVLSGGLGAWFFVANHGPEAPCLADIGAARGLDAASSDVGRSRKKIDYADPSSRVEAARVPADDWACGLAAMLLAREVVLAARAGGVASSTPPIRLVAFQSVADETIGSVFQWPLQVTRVAAPRRADCTVCARVAEPTEAEHAANLAFFTEESSS